MVEYNYYKQELFLALIAYYKDVYTLDEILAKVHEIAKQFIEP